MHATRRERVARVSQATLDRAPRAPPRAPAGRAPRGAAAAANAGPAAVHPPRRQASRHGRVQRAPVHRDRRPCADHGAGARGLHGVHVPARQPRTPAADGDERQVDRAARERGEVRHRGERRGVAREPDAQGVASRRRTRSRRSAGAASAGGTCTAVTMRTRTSEPGTVHHSCRTARRRRRSPCGAASARSRARSAPGRRRAARSEPSSAWSWCRCESSTASRVLPSPPRRGAAPRRRSSPACRSSSGSVSSRTPSRSSTVLACPSQRSGTVTAAGPPRVRPPDQLLVHRLGADEDLVVADRLAQLVVHGPVASGAAGRRGSARRRCHRASRPGPRTRARARGRSRWR